MNPKLKIPSWHDNKNAIIVNHIKRQETANEPNITVRRQLRACRSSSSHAAQTNLTIAKDFSPRTAG